jgi:ElaB/YqjD/DUF883 family membrane-anchored ribosome-binding protein
MGIFSKYKGMESLPAVVTSEIDDPLADAVPVDTVAAPVDDSVIVPVDDTVTTDVIDTDDNRYDAQRQELNQATDAALTSELDAPAKVDGEDDDMSVDGTKTETDAEVAEGDFGREVEITDTKDGVHADADDSEVKFTNEIDQESRDVDAELDMIEQESFGIESLVNEISMLAGAQDAIAAHGFNPTAAAIMQTTGLLSGTSLDTIALESINFTNGESDESKMALETLGDKIKEKGAQWAAKIVSVAKNTGDKIMGVLTPLYTKITGLISSAASASWDGAKAAGRTVKAHPYKTAAAVVAAVVAVAGVVAFASGAPAAGAKVDVLRKFSNDLLGKVRGVKWPFGSFGGKVADDGVLRLTFDPNAASREFLHSGPVDKLGWTQTTVKVLGAQLTKAFDMIKHAWSAFGARAAKIASSSADAIKTGAAAALDTKAGKAATVAGGVALLSAHVRGTAEAWISAISGYVRGFVAQTMAMFQITRWVVVTGFRMIQATLNAILPGRSTPAEA